MKPAAALMTLVLASSCVGMEPVRPVRLADLRNPVLALEGKEASHLFPVLHHDAEEGLPCPVLGEETVVQVDGRDVPVWGGGVRDEALDGPGPRCNPFFTQPTWRTGAGGPTTVSFRDSTAHLFMQVEGFHDLVSVVPAPGSAVTHRAGDVLALQWQPASDMLEDVHVAFDIRRLGERVTADTVTLDGSALDVTLPEMASRSTVDVTVSATYTLRVSRCDGAASCTTPARRAELELRVRTE
jgi:hypothetical protein